MSEEYNKVREQYRPDKIKVLMIAESPPPAPEVQSSRQFYYTERERGDDRLFTNTMQALYPEAVTLGDTELQAHKEEWLQRFASDGWYMIEALEESLAHEVTKTQRQERIREALPRLIARVRELAEPDTTLILVKSNVFDVACQPLREAGFNVPQTELIDYPGRFNQRVFRAKLAAYGR